MKETFDPGKRIVRTAVNWDSENLALISYLTSRFTYRDEASWRQLITDGIITVNGQKASPETLLVRHDMVEYHADELPEPPAELHYQILYEDSDLLIVDKPGNLCVHPAGPFFKHTLWYLMVRDFGKDLHFINRLDRETSGVMTVARNKETAALAANTVMHKTYAAAVYGDFPARLDGKGFLYTSPTGIIRKKRTFATVPCPGIKCESVDTGFELISGNGEFSLVKARLGTGRMHQIRATLFSSGFPVVGDKLYGKDESFYIKQKHETLTDADRKILVLNRQALHSSDISFCHPVSGREIIASSPIPPEFLPDNLSKLAKKDTGA